MNWFLVDIIGILFRSCSIVGFWVITAYVVGMGMYVVYELDIEEWYINPLNSWWLNVVQLSKNLQ